MKIEIQQGQLSRKATIILSFILFELILIWLFSLYAYSSLPPEIPTHFGLNGNPDAYGSKSTFLMLPIIFTTMPIIFLLIIKYRFTLITKYPYLINISSEFITYFSKIQKSRQNYYVNKYFEIFLFVGAFITFYLFVLEVGIYFGTIKEKIPSWFLPFTIIVPILFIPLYIIKIRKIMQEIKKEAENGVK